MSLRLAQVGVVHANGRRALSAVDLVVAAGNVMPLLAAGSEAAVITGLADLLSAGGRLVAGFGLDAAHLPLAAPPFGLDEYDAWCGAARLSLVERYATWQSDQYGGGGYAVSVHVREGTT